MPSGVMKLSIQHADESATTYSAVRIRGLSAVKVAPRSATYVSKIGLVRDAAAVGVVHSAYTFLVWVMSKVGCPGLQLEDHLFLGTSIQVTSAANLHKGQDLDSTSC